MKAICPFCSLKIKYSIQQIRCRCCSDEGQPKKRSRHDPTLSESENDYCFNQRDGILWSAMTNSGYNDTSVRPET